MLREDSQRVFPELADNQHRGSRTDSPDEAASQIPLNSQQRRRVLNLAGKALKLAAVRLVFGPFAGEHRLFTWAHFRQGTHDGDLMPSGPDSHHGPAVFRVAENGSQNSGLQLFHASPPANMMPGYGYYAIGMTCFQRFARKETRTPAENSDR